MTFLPPSNIGAEQTPPTPPLRRRARWGALVAWIVILLSATALIVRPRWTEHHRAESTAPSQPLPSIADTPSPQLQLVSHYVVGAKSMAGAKAPPAADLLKQVDQATTNAIDEFRAIIIVGEVSGAQEALQRLDSFEKNHKVVRLRPDVDALRIIYQRGTDALTPDQGRALVQRHQWFGKLAVAYNLPTTDPRRIEVMKPAKRSVVAMVAAFFAAMGGVACGIALAVLLLILWTQKRWRPAYTRPGDSIAGPFVEAFALYLLGMILLSQVISRLLPNAGLGASFLLLALLPIVFIYLRLRGIPWAQMMSALGWHRGQGVWREIGAGLYGYVAGLPLLVLGIVITYFLMKITGNNASHPIVNQPVENNSDVLQLFLLASVAAPIIEETMFRGALLGHLRSYLPWWIAAPIVSLLFAAIHPQGWVAIPVLGAIAMTLAALREFRDSLIASMTAHALSNAITLLLMVLMAR
jgi:membrane protease YdiL (CAAX protease family)